MGLANKHWLPREAQCSVKSEQVARAPLCGGALMSLLPTMCAVACTVAPTGQGNKGRKKNNKKKRGKAPVGRRTIRKVPESVGWAGGDGECVLGRGGGCGVVG